MPAMPHAWARFVLLIVALTSIAFGCAAVDRGDTTLIAPTDGLLIKGAGATFPSVLYKRWFAIYQSRHPKTVIAYDAVGSSEGVERLIGKDVKEEKLVDFGASDAAMTDKQISETPGGAVMLPATAGSVVLVYNLPDFQGDLRLSREAYAGIFLGQIRNWNDPRIVATNPAGQLPNLTIAPVVRQDGSGTTFAFTNHLNAINPVWHGRYGAATVVDWPGNAMRAVGNEGVAGRVSHSIGSSGYVGYEFARQLGLKMATLENRQGEFVKPNHSTGAAALRNIEFPQNLRAFVPDPDGVDAYPIVTFSWILLRKNYADAKQGNAIRELFQWCLQEGQEYAEELGYIQLPSDASARSIAALSAVSAAK